MYKTVLPACTNGVCASGPNKGWILKDPNGPPKNVRKKRTRAMLSNQEVAERTKVIADAQQITQLGSGRSTSEEFTGWHSTMTKYWRSLRALKKPRKGATGTRYKYYVYLRNPFKYIYFIPCLCNLWCLIRSELFWCVFCIMKFVGSDLEIRSLGM